MEIKINPTKRDEIPPITMQDIIKTFGLCWGEKEVEKSIYQYLGAMIAQAKEKIKIKKEEEQK